MSAFSFKRWHEICDLWSWHSRHLTAVKQSDGASCSLESDRWSRSFPAMGGRTRRTFYLPICGGEGVHFSLSMLTLWSSIVQSPARESIWELGITQSGYFLFDKFLLFANHPSTQDRPTEYKESALRHRAPWVQFSFTVAGTVVLGLLKPLRLPYSETTVVVSKKCVERKLEKFERLRFRRKVQSSFTTLRFGCRGFRLSRPRLSRMCWFQCV